MGFVNSPASDSTRSLLILTGSFLCVSVSVVFAHLLSCSLSLCSCSFLGFMMISTTSTSKSTSKSTNMNVGVVNRRSSCRGLLIPTRAKSSSASTGIRPCRSSASSSSCCYQRRISDAGVGASAPQRRQHSHSHISRRSRRSTSPPPAAAAALVAPLALLPGAAFSVGGMSSTSSFGSLAVLVNVTRLCSFAAAMVLLLQMADNSSGGSDDDDDGPSGGVPVPLYVRVDEDKPTPYNEDRGQQRY